MSARIRKTNLCDLCGAVTEDQSHVWAPGAVDCPLPTANSVRFAHGMRADLCDECAAPVLKALQARVAALGDRFKPPGSQTDRT